MGVYSGLYGGSSAPAASGGGGLYGSLFGQTQSSSGGGGGGGILGDITGAIGTGLSDVGNLAGNASNDAMNFVTQGLPALADLGVSNVAAPFAGLYGATGLPGASSALHFAEAVPKADVAAGKGMLSYYENKYGPILGNIVHGNLGAAAEGFGKALYSHPLYTGLDIASAVSGGEGALARLGGIAPKLAARSAADAAASAGVDQAGQAAG